MSGVGLGAGIWNTQISNPISTGQILRGLTAMANGTDTFTITFPSVGTTNYTAVVTIQNTVDVTIRHLTPTISAKTATSITFVTQQTTDHANYKANWVIVLL